MRWLPLMLLFACTGPAAPDPDLCRDYIHRICLTDVCPVVAPLVPTNADCETTFQTRSGCASDSFTFKSPTRARFLDCRLALLRSGDSVEQHPNCDDVTESFDRCPEVAAMFSGGTP